MAGQTYPSLEVSPLLWTPLSVMVRGKQPFVASQIIDAYVTMLFKAARTAKEREAASSIYDAWKIYYLPLEAYKEGYKQAEIDRWVQRVETTIQYGWGNGPKELRGLLTGDNSNIVAAAIGVGMAIAAVAFGALFLKE